MSIAKLLEAQKIDKQRLELVQALEKGKVKVELDKAQNTIAESKQNLLQLENEAKSLQDNYKKIEKIVADTLNLVEKAKKSQSEDASEYGNYLSTLSVLESQLADMERRIADKTAAFKSTTLSVMKASEFVKRNSQLLDEQKKNLAEKLQVLDQQFNEKTQGIDEKLLTKYKTVRKSKAGDTKDVVVPLTDNRCYGCYMEVPAATISKINTNGWAICEECGRIIYKDASAK